MAGLFYLVALSAIVVTIIWAIMNDRVGLFEKTKGILAMKDDYGSIADEGNDGASSRNRNGSRGRGRPGARTQSQ